MCLFMCFVSSMPKAWADLADSVVVLGCVWSIEGCVQTQKFECAGVFQAYVLLMCVRPHLPTCGDCISWSVLLYWSLKMSMFVQAYSTKTLLGYRCL